MNTGKFIATVSVSGRAMDAKGNIIQRDSNGLPTMWLNVMAGTIPNRQTIAGTVIQRMGIPIDENGVIASGNENGNPFAKRIIYGSWLYTADDERYGPQFSWSMIKDLSDSSIVELEKSISFLGNPSVFTVERPELPADYERKTVQHIGRAKMDPKVHNVSSNAQSNPVQTARQDLGAIPSDTGENPEVVVTPKVNITND
jgi:hypothetical protein